VAVSPGPAEDRDTDLDSYPSAVHQAVHAGHQRLAELVDGLSEEQAREPSALPGWSRAHVLTHLGGLARAFTRQTRYALAGQLVEVYDGGRAGRDAAIDAGARRAAADLVADVVASDAELDRAWAALHPHQWALPCRYRDGTLQQALLCRWREVEVHTADLGLGVTPADWDPTLCAHLLDFLAPRTPSGVRLTLEPDDHDKTWTSGAGTPLTVHGHLRDLTAWMAGRTPIAPLTSTTDGLPRLNPWP
jgi:maleylpyruvate isomerase